MAETIQGMNELQKTIKTLGKLPQKCVTTASKKGATIGLKAVKANAPVDEGELKKGIVLKGERSKAKGKKVYQVTLDKNKNDVFAKESKAGKRSYYPASQEYGFQTVNGKYIPGYQYMKQSADGNDRTIKGTMIETLSKEIDKLK